MVSGLWSDEGLALGALMMSGREVTDQYRNRVTGIGIHWNRLTF